MEHSWSPADRLCGVCVALVLLLVAPHIAEEIFPSSASTAIPPAHRRAGWDARGCDGRPGQAGPGRSSGSTAGDKNLDLTLGYVGTQGSSYPINAVFLWTSGPQQAIINVGLQAGQFAQARRPGRATSQKSAATVSRGPVLIRSWRPDQSDSQLRLFIFGRSQRSPARSMRMLRATPRRFARSSPESRQLRDLEYEEPLHYPTVDIRVNRAMAGQLGTTADAGRLRGCVRDRFEPLCRAELLARSALGRQLPGAGAGAATKDDFARRHREHSRRRAQRAHSRW